MKSITIGVVALVAVLSLLVASVFSDQPRADAKTVHDLYWRCINSEVERQGLLHTHVESRYVGKGVWMASLFDEGSKIDLHDDDETTLLYANFDEKTGLWTGFVGTCQ